MYSPGWMLVASFVGEWARNTGSVAFAFIIFDATGTSLLGDRPGLRLAVVVGTAFLGAALKHLTGSNSPQDKTPN